MAQWLSERVGPGGEVIAVDIDMALLSTIKEPGFEARQHDLATHEPVGDNFDLIHSRFVLEHILDPDRVLADLVRQLRPGGWLVVLDAEFSTTALTDQPAYAAAMAAFGGAMHARGTDYQWTRTLPAAFHRLGLLGVQAAAEVAWFQGGSDPARFWASNFEAMRSEILATGLAESLYEQALDVMFEPSHWLPDIMVLAATGKSP
jgi:ubiquinone/menaquinone biosynthesis C-methylase UbiE